jgi:hypothetical protein
MKKILCTLAVVGLASSLYAQGLVAFANNNATLVKLDSGAAAPVGSTFAALVWAPVGTAIPVAWDGTKDLTQWLSANPGWSAMLADKIALGPAAGRFNKGLTVPTAVAGAGIEGMVAAWGGGKATFDEAYTAGDPVGLSGKFTLAATGNPTTVPPGTGVSIVTGANPAFAGVTIAPVPEPSTFALAGLGAAALLIFRRRN